MSQKSIETVYSEDTFQAAANFSHARIYGGLIYASGQIPLDRAGNVVGTTIEEQTEQVLKNHFAILKEAGSTPDRILRMNVYLVQTGDYAGFNNVYAKMMPDPKPPRGCVFVSSLPAGSKVEINLVAAQ